MLPGWAIAPWQWEVFKQAIASDRDERAIAQSAPAYSPSLLLSETLRERDSNANGPENRIASRREADRPTDCLIIA
ncbi:MAG: hypothetical protein U7123_16685 [Potamolinea sp.]